MSHEKFAACIEACYRCAATCDHCATACLQEPDPKMLVDCVRSDLDCAEVCRIATAAMARGSDSVAQICRLCAELCDKCATECEKHKHDHCKECAKACRDCAEECRKIAA